MPYGAIKVDNITFTNDGADQPTTVSGIYRAITSGVTVTGTISGVTIQGATVSGTTVTGTTANFVSGVFTTQLSGVTVTGTTASFTSGVFTALSGTTTTVTSGIFGAGSAAAPSISFTSDPNTGIYSPGADQVAISTNGSGRLYVDASGNVGVAGTPTARFTVVGSAGSVEFASDGATLNFTRNAANYIQAAGASATLSYRSPVHIFTGASLSTEYMRLDSSGRLGLGTSSPSDLLHISAAGADTAAIRLQASSGRSYLLGSTGSGYGSANNFIIYDATASAARLTVNSSGNVGIGTSSPNKLLHVAGTEFVVGAYQLELEGRFAGYGAGLQFSSRTTDGGTLLGMAKITADGEAPWDTTAANQDAGLRFYTTLNGTLAEKLRIDASGQVGIGTTSPVAPLTVQLPGVVGEVARFVNGGSAARLHFYTDTTSKVESQNSNLGLFAYDSYNVTFGTVNIERARIDSSGRLLVGTSSAPVAGKLFVQGNSFSATEGGVLHLMRGEGATAITTGEEIGKIAFSDNAGNDFATITTLADSAAGTNDYPGRLVFSTTADGAATPTERMRISSGGDIFLAAQAGTTTYPGEGNTSNGWMAEGANGKTFISTSSLPSLSLNRNVDDGVIVSIRQAGTEEGTISVSGTTVSYNGAHLSRWSQLPGGTKRTEILRGTVLSNIDEMCGWGEEDNEQLNRMKVSDVEGDKNVSGVFQSWDDDDDTYTDDFYCAMTGDFIIRIAEGVTVQRGDLLMSAGDGTAKPQDDDIIRSKTVAKVTSTHITCTYEDGSYCVPCVLMAC